MNRNLRYFIKATLTEGIVPEDKIGFVWDEQVGPDNTTGGISVGRLGVIFNAEGLIDKLNRLNFVNSKHGSLLEDLIKQSILGMIFITPPRQPCNGAWEVRLSAGKSYGSLIYAAGYKISPTGTLMSDRKSLSKDAQNAWKKVSRKIKGKPLDDYKHPRNSDPNDDCEVWAYDSKIPNEKVNENPPGTNDQETADAVNHSYKSSKNYDWQGMSDRFEEIVFFTGVKKSKLMEMFTKGAVELFNTSYA